MIKLVKISFQKAFTLFEVMIALAILSIAMIAGLVTTNTVLERTVYVEKKILAHWVGMNIINKLQLKVLKEQSDVIKSNGTDNMRGRDFNWDLTIDKVNFFNEDLLVARVDIYEKSSSDNSILNTVTRKIPIR